MSRTVRMAMIEHGRETLSVRRQCALLGLVRSGIYRTPAGADEEDLALMRRLDEQYLATPLLWLTADDGGAAGGRPCGQSQAGPAADAADGT